MERPFFGNAVLEQVQLVAGRCIWSEKHYFNLMSSMRLSRMEIPKDFTLDRFEELVFQAKRTEDEVISIWAFTQPCDHYQEEQVSFWASPAPNIPDWSQLHPQSLGLYRDFYKPAGLLSQLRSNNTLLERAAGVFAQENDYGQVALLNANKYLASACFANIFLVFEEKILTPSIEAGAYKGVIHQESLIALRESGITLEESEELSPFEMQRAQEIFWIETFGVSYAPSFRNNDLKHDIAQQALNATKERFSHE